MGSPLSRLFFFLELLYMKFSELRTISIPNWIIYLTKVWINSTIWISTYNLLSELWIISVSPDYISPKFEYNKEMYPASSHSEGDWSKSDEVS